MPKCRLRLYIKNRFAVVMRALLHNARRRPYIQKSSCRSTGRICILKIAALQPCGNYCIMRGGVRIFKKVHAEVQAAPVYSKQPLTAPRRALAAAYTQGAAVLRRYVFLNICFKFPCRQGLPQLQAEHLRRLLLPAGMNIHRGCGLCRLRSG